METVITEIDGSDAEGINRTIVEWKLVAGFVVDVNKLVLIALL